MDEDQNVKLSPDYDPSQGEEPTKKKKKSKLILIIPIALVVIAGVGFGVMQFMGGDSKKAENEGDAEGQAIEQAAPSFFVPIDPMTVNLRGQGKQQRFLKLVVRLEIGQKEDEQIIKDYMPRIRDQLQVFLRELRVEDIEGSSGAYRIREELLSRINTVAKPATVKDVLFDELLVQ